MVVLALHSVSLSGRYSAHGESEMADANKLGKGSLEEICDADLARIALSGV